MHLQRTKWACVGYTGPIRTGPRPGILYPSCGRTSQSEFKVGLSDFKVTQTQPHMPKMNPKSPKATQHDPKVAPSSHQSR